MRFTSLAMLLLAALLLMSSSLSQAQESNYKPQEVAVIDGTVWNVGTVQTDLPVMNVFEMLAVPGISHISPDLPDTVVMLKPGELFINNSADTWYAMTRYRLEIAVSNTRSLANCEKLLIEADKRDNRNLWGNRIREGIIIGLAAAYILK